MFQLTTFFGGIAMNTRTILGIVTISTILVISLSAFAGEPDAEIDDLRTELARLQAENQELREKAERLEKYNQGWHDWYVYLTKLCDEHGIEYRKRLDHVQEPQPEQVDAGKPIKAIWAGFRGIQWGTEIGSIDGLTFRENTAGLVWYSRDADVLKIGAADLSYIAYGFYKDKLQKVIISCEGFGNSEAFTAAVEATYGKQSKRGFFLHYLCVGGDAGRQVSVFLSENRFLNTVSCIITYRPLEQQKERDDAEAAKRAIEDF